MKKFLTYFAIFIVPVFVAALATDHFLSAALKNYNVHAAGVWNDLFKGAINADIVIHGSSRARHISPRILEDELGTSAYNLGIDGHNFLMQYCRHKILLHYNRKPTLIIHSLDYFTLAKRPDLYEMQQFLPYFSDRNITSTIKHYAGYSSLDYNVPLLRYYGKKTAIFNALKTVATPHHCVQTLYKGYKGVNAGWNRDLEKAKTSGTVLTIKLDTLSLQLFDNYLVECRQSGIDLILIYTPEFHEGQSLVKNRGEIFDLFKGYALRHGVPFLDYSCDSISYQKKYFYNSQHMNKTGAELFSKKLVKDLKQYIQFKTINRLANPGLHQKEG